MFRPGSGPFSQSTRGPSTDIEEGRIKLCRVRRLQKEVSEHPHAEVNVPTDTGGSRPTGPFAMHTDPCVYQIGCVLLQQQEDDSLRPI